MLKHRDVRGYYYTLGLEPIANTAAIREAYRRLAKKVHPDRHSLDPGATAKFQKLAEAYEALSNPELRALYDAESLIAAPRYEAKRLACDRCGTIRPQLRYVIFPFVNGCYLRKTCSTFEGLYCLRCAQAKAMQAVILTWLMGWWRLPKGPIWSIKALFQIMAGDVYPDDKNADFLLQQAHYYLSLGELNVAGGLLSRAEKLVKTGVDRQRLAELLRLVNPSKYSVRISEIQWSWFIGIQFLPLAPFLLVFMVIGISLIEGNPSRPIVTQEREIGVITIDAR